MRMVFVLCSLLLAGCAGKESLYYLACPKLGTWNALEKWPEDCAPLKARLGVK